MRTCFVNEGEGNVAASGEGNSVVCREECDAQEQERESEGHEVL